MTELRAAWALLPTGIAEDVWISLGEQGEIVALRAGKPSDGPLRPVGLLPGLINAHLHVELSWLKGELPRGGGFADWAAALMLQRGAEPELGSQQSVAFHEARAMREAGTAAVCDVANASWTRSLWQDAGLCAVVQREVLSFDPARQSAMRGVIAGCAGQISDSLVERPAPHALFSTSPELVRAAVAAGPSAVASTIHLAEDAAERVFLNSGTGPYAGVLDRLGVDWRWWQAPGLDPVRVLDALGVLGPKLLCVHGVDLRADELALMAAARAPLCLCVRSNAYIGGKLPDVPAMLKAGVSLCLGTDSLASNDDLDVMGEVFALTRAFPEVPIARWLVAATSGGAAALGMSGLGTLKVGARPGVLTVGAKRPELMGAGAERRWVAPAGPAWRRA